MSRRLQRADMVSGSGRIVSDWHHMVELLGQQNYLLARTFTAARRLIPVPA